MRTTEIHCDACGQTALVRSEPVYAGFKKIGEAYRCVLCGAYYDCAATTPFVQKTARPTVFTEEDKPQRPSIFSEDERQRCCGWCRHFVVNPFNQRCGLENRETQATDLCVRFEKNPLPQDQPPNINSPQASDPNELRIF